MGFETRPSLLQGEEGASLQFPSGEVLIAKDMGEVKCIGRGKAGRDMRRVHSLCWQRGSGTSFLNPEGLLKKRSQREFQAPGTRSGLASKKRRVRTGHWVSCFAFRSQRVIDSPARSGGAGDYRRSRCSQRSPAVPG